jgi:hypothetical protein
MIDLEKEAEEYRKKWIFLESGDTINDIFIAGANSKFVQSKILQAQIDVLEKAWILKPPVDELIYSLNQQLKDLQP